MSFFKWITSRLSNRARRRVSCQFFVGLMPYETELLARVGQSKDIQAIVTNRAHILAKLIPPLFDLWRPAVTASAALGGIAQDVEELEDEREAIGSQAVEIEFALRENAYRCFMGYMSMPYTTNQCRADRADPQNATFKEAFLSASNLIQFFESVEFVALKEDSNSWNILGAMLLCFPDEMSRWIIEKPIIADFGFFSECFDICTVVKMYCIHTLRPGSRVSLTELVKSKHNSVGVKLWEQFERTNQERQQRREAMFPNIASGLVEDPTEGLEARDSHRKSKLKVVLDRALRPRSLLFGRGKKPQLPPLNLNSFLSGIFGHGHLDFLCSEKLEIVSREKFLMSKSTTIGRST